MFSSKEGYQNVPYDNLTRECESRNIEDTFGQVPCAVGGIDDYTWLAEGLKTLSVAVPHKKGKHHGIVLLAC